MLPSLHWLLLLWGLQGLLAQDYEEDYEEEVEVPPPPRRRNNNKLSINSIPQNGKCKLCQVLSQVASLFPSPEKKTQQGHRWRMQSTWIDRISLRFLHAIHLPGTTAQCSVTQMFYPLRILFPQAPSLRDIVFPPKINVIYPQPPY